MGKPKKKNELSGEKSRYKKISYLASHLLFISKRYLEHRTTWPFTDYLNYLRARVIVLGTAPAWQTQCPGTKNK